jgi:hypothetical protein
MWIFWLIELPEREPTISRVIQLDPQFAEPLDDAAQEFPFHDPLAKRTGAQEELDDDPFVRQLVDAQDFRFSSPPLPACAILWIQLPGVSRFRAYRVPISVLRTHGRECELIWHKNCSVVFSPTVWIYC